MFLITKRKGIQHTHTFIKLKRMRMRKKWKEKLSGGVMCSRRVHLYEWMEERAAMHVLAYCTLIQYTHVI